jgi:hypothetical protein
MDITDIQAKVSAGEYLFSQHADQERQADNLTVAQVEEALLDGSILESYPDTGRGESCLVVGFGGGEPIHAVCVARRAPGHRHDLRAQASKVC